MQRRLVLAGLAATLVAPWRPASADGLLDSLSSGDTDSLTNSLGGLSGNSGSSRVSKGQLAQ